MFLFRRPIKRLPIFLLLLISNQHYVIATVNIPAFFEDKTVPHQNMQASVLKSSGQEYIFQIFSSRKKINYQIGIDESCNGKTNFVTLSGLYEITMSNGKPKEMLKDTS